MLPFLCLCVCLCAWVCVFLVFLFLFSLVVCLDRGAQYLKLSCQMSSESDP